MPVLDAAVWNDFRAGSERAFERIFLTYYDQLYGYGIRLVSDQEVVKDCIQTLFHRLWQRRTKLSAVEDIRPYLFKALRNEVAAELTAQQRRAELPTDYPREFAVQFSTEDFLIAQQFTAEQHTQLLAALSRLNNRQREAVHLRFFEGFTYDRIAEIMELQPQSVRNLVHQGITRLRQALPPLCLMGPGLVAMAAKYLKIINLIINNL